MSEPNQVELIKMLNDLLAIKRKKENKEELTKKEQAQFLKFLKNESIKAYINKDTETLTKDIEALKQQDEGKDFTIASPHDTQSIVAAYNADFFDKVSGKYKDGYQEPQLTKDGDVKLRFPSEEKAIEFFRKQAKQGKNFYILDKNQHVIGFAKDGVLYDGKSNELQNKFVSSGVPPEQFNPSKSHNP